MPIPIQNLQKKMPLIIAFASGILALALLRVYLQQKENALIRRVEQQIKIQAQQAQQSAVAPAQQMVNVLIAQKDIPAQTPVTEGDLAFREIPVEYIQPGAVTSVGQAVGQITSVPIAAGEQLLRGKLLPPGKSGQSLSEITPEGKRALTITVDRMADVAALFRPGDYVDVLAFITPPPAADGSKVAPPGPKLVTLSQDVKVLAVGSQLASLPGVSPALKAGEPKGASSGTITLALSPQEAVLISFVQEHGKIKLTLRSPEDNKRGSNQLVGWDTLLRYLYPSVPTEEPGAEETVEVYHGLNKEIMPLTITDITNITDKK